MWLVSLRTDPTRRRRRATCADSGDSSSAVEDSAVVEARDVTVGVSPVAPKLRTTRSKRSPAPSLVGLWDSSATGSGSLMAGWSGASTRLSTAGSPSAAGADVGIAVDGAQRPRVTRRPARDRRAGSDTSTASATRQGRGRGSNLCSGDLLDDGRIESGTQEGVGRHPLREGCAAVSADPTVSEYRQAGHRPRLRTRRRGVRGAGPPEKSPMSPAPTRAT